MFALETWRPELSRLERHELASLKLSLVGLAGTDHLYPSELSGGMRKRAGLARALALIPEVLFLTNHRQGWIRSAQWRSMSSSLQLRDSLGASIVLVTHELPSIYRVADTCLFLDNKTRTR